MRFAIGRTSRPDDVGPCEEAYRDKCITVDERGADDPAKVPAHRGQSDWWCERGKNHRIEDGHIKRDFDGEGWFIDIETLDELLSFIAKYEQAVLGPWYNNPDILRIEIYDDWRE